MRVTVYKGEHLLTWAEAVELARRSRMDFARLRRELAEAEALRQRHLEGGDDGAEPRG